MEKLKKLFRCPFCKGNFIGGRENYKCKLCGRKYPVFRNVPILLSNFRKKDFEKTKKSFSQEWGMFKKGDKTWTWDIKERKKLLAKELDLNSLEQMKGKIILDAGCGNGQLTSAIADYCRIIGMDLSQSIFKAEERKAIITKKPENVLFIEGNIANPPFKKHSFDIIYSSGVLHHTPNTFKSFSCLIPLLKKHGKCYIYLYRKDRKDETAITYLIYKSREITKHLPLFLVNILCTILAPFAKLYADTTTKLNIRKSTVRSIREHRLSLYDHFSPRFAYRHTIPEVKSWFKKFGFKEKVTFEDRNGFGILGTR